MLSKLVEQGAKRFMVWALGERGASFFSRRLEVRLSSLLILAMAAVIFMMLILSYWKSPEPGDPYFNRRWAAEGDSEPLERSPSQSGSRGGNGVDSSGTSGSASLTTEGTVVSKGTVVPKGTVIPKNTVVPKGTVELKGLARPLPLWGPSSTDVAGGARPDRRGPSLTAPSEGRRDPELRNVAAPPPTPFEDSLAPSAPAAASTPAAQDPASPYIYLIQVRAKESMEGAKRILEYLSANFGLGPAYIERDLRGDHNAEGKVLYTAFVGPYFRRVEADKECERLKKETRRTPYRNKEDFFQDCLVITRTR